MSVLVPVRSHAPATDGTRCGVTLPSVTGFENVTEIAVFDATSSAPEAGVEDLTKKPRSDALVAPLEPE